MEVVLVGKMIGVTGKTIHTSELNALGGNSNEDCSLVCGMFLNNQW